jgi:hypothetical protein
MVVKASVSHEGQGGVLVATESFLHEIESDMIIMQLIEMHIVFKCFIVAGLRVNDKVALVL